MTLPVFSRSDLDGLRVPVPRPPHLARQNALYEPLREEFRAWIGSVGLFTAEQAQLIDVQDYALCASLLWPEANYQRLLDLTMASAIITLRDDELEADQYRGSRTALTHALAEAEAGHSIQLDPRWGGPFADLWHRFAGYLPTRQLQRLSSSVAELVRGCAEVAARHATGQGFRDLDDYLHLRRATIGHTLCLVLAEIGLEIDLSDVIDEPLLKKVIQSDSERFIAAEGLLTLRKELAQGDCDGENFVVALARLRGFPLAEALEATHEFYQQAAARHATVAATVTDSALGKKDNVLAFLAGMDDNIAGLIAFATRSARYITTSEPMAGDENGPNPVNE